MSKSQWRTTRRVPFVPFNAPLMLPTFQVSTLNRLSQSHNEYASKSTPVAQSDSSFIQQRLSARQAKRVAKVAKRQEKSDALKEEVRLFSFISKKKSNNPKRATFSFAMATFWTPWIDTSKLSPCTGHLSRRFCCPIWPPRISSWTCPWNGFLFVSKNTNHSNIQVP